MKLNWQRCDLIHWGEYLETKVGRFTRRWIFTDRAKNPDGLLFFFAGPDGIEHGPYETEQDVNDEIRKTVDQ